MGLLNALQGEHSAWPDGWPTDNGRRWTLRPVSFAAPRTCRFVVTVASFGARAGATGGTHGTGYQERFYGLCGRSKRPPWLLMLGRPERHVWGRRFPKWKVLATKPGWRDWHPNAMRLGLGRLMRLGPSALDATNSNSG